MNAAAHMQRPALPVVGTQIPPFWHGFIEQKVAGATVTVTGATVTGPAVIGAAELVIGKADVAGKVT